MTAAPCYQRFGTPGVTPRDRFEYWRTWYSQAVDVPMRLDPVSRLPRDFRASAEVLSCGDVDLVELHCGPARGSWRQEDTEAAGQVRLIILAPTAAGAGHWHGRELPLDGGSPVLLGHTDGWWHAPAGLHGVQVNVPRVAVGVPAADVETATRQQYVRHHPVFTSLIRPALLGLAGRLGDLSRNDVADLGAVWSSLITMMLRALREQALDGADLAPARRVQAQRFILAHLSDPGLSPAAVAAALHVSRRALYSCLPAGEGVAAWIRRQRLQRARALLMDPAESRSVAQIAAAVGLPSPAHFSRLFRAEYGHSPRDLRARRGTGPTPAAARMPRV
jgi:AraC-like DNA-binding protein